VEFIVANTDAQQLMHSRADRRIQLGPHITQGLGAGAKPEVGKAAAEEAADELYRHLDGAHMVFITAGMGGGTGTGAAPVIARMARERNILTVGVVTKPFGFEGVRRARCADQGIEELQQYVDTLIVIPNQNLFRMANERTTWKDAFKMADQVLYMGVRGVTDLMMAPGLVNLDFADIRTVMAEMGKAMMGTGEAEGENRAIRASEAAISNPLLEDTSMAGARGLLINITGGDDLTLFEVDQAANRIREEVDEEANIIFGSAIDESLTGKIRVSVVATGIEQALISRNSGNAPAPAVAAVATSNSSPDTRLAELTARLRADNARLAERAQKIESSSTAQPAPQLRPGNTIERAALAAIAAAVAPEAAKTPAAPAPLQPAAYGDVTVRPIAQKPSLFPDPEGAAAPAPESTPPETFIPQAAERPPSRAPRMPKFEELPMPAQNEIRQARGEVEEEHPQKTRMSLLQRLANGLSRRDEEDESPISGRPSGPAMPAMPSMPERKPQRSVAEQMASRPVSEYAPRQAPQGLDTHGRQAPVAPAPQGDDHLDIPAFLRRQVN